MLILLWIAHFEFEIFPNSYRIKHGNDETKSSWDFISSRRKLNNINSLKIECVQEDLQVVNHHFIVDDANHVQVYIRFQFFLSHCAREDSRFRIC